MSFNLENKKIFIAGHNGMVGKAITNQLLKMNLNVITQDKSNLDLLDSSQVEKFMNITKPDVVIVCAAKVGGIIANVNSPYTFLFENLSIQSNLLNSARKEEVKKLIFLGSSCIYPRNCKQPIKESYLLSDLLEKTNEAYAIAKISGIKMCQSIRRQFNLDFISVMPTNLYGPNDNFDRDNSHVIPGIIRKIYEAKKNGENTVELWGTGKPLREFLHVEDCADGIIFLLKNYSEDSHINLGSGEEISIEKLAYEIKNLMSFNGKIIFNKSFPDGTPRKFLDSSRINNLGWKPKINLSNGLKNTIDFFIKNEIK